MKCAPQPVGGLTNASVSQKRWEEDKSAELDFSYPTRLHLPTDLIVLWQPWKNTALHRARASQMFLQFLPFPTREEYIAAPSFKKILPARAIFRRAESQSSLSREIWFILNLKFHRATSPWQTMLKLENQNRVSPQMLLVVKTRYCAAMSNRLRYSAPHSIF